MQGRLSRLAALRDHAVFVACRDGAVVGWIHVSEVHHVQADTRAEIGGMVVAPAFRSAGIGKRLVEATERWATERGLCSILVRSQAAREAAHRFYLREGYARTKTSAVFTKALAQQGRQLE